MGQAHPAQQAALAALGVPWAKAAVPAPSSPASVDEGPLQPAPSDAQAQDDHEQGDTVTEEEREAARGTARMRVDEDAADGFDDVGDVGARGDGRRSTWP